MTGARPGLGVTLVVVMGRLFAAMDTRIRWLAGAMPVLLMLTARYLFQALVMAGWLALDPRQRFVSAHPRLQALRGLLLLVTSGFSFFGLQVLPGWLVFHHLPDAWGWAGLAVIGACGAASAWLDVRRVPASFVDSVAD